MYQFIKRHLKGQVNIPSSKSIAHRALICAALSKGKSYLYDIDLSKDLLATLHVLETLGAKIEIHDQEIIVEGIQEYPKEGTFHCHESGTTLRLLMPLAISFVDKTEWLRDSSLKQRPLDVYYSLFNKQHVLYKETDSTLKIEGKIKPGTFELEGHISSQFISGLLFLLPLLNEDSYITMKTPLQSKSYVDLTISVLRSFNITIIEKEDSYFIPGNQVYKACSYRVEKDYSQAAFYLMAASNRHDIVVNGLNLDSLQGDRKLLEKLHLLGLDYRVSPLGIHVIRNKKKPIHIDGQDCPDLICALIIGLITIDGVSSIKNVERLNYKESHRLNVLLEYICQLGATAWVEKNTLYIQGNTHLKGTTLSTYHDHRMAMLLSMLALECDEGIVVDDIQCVSKSYPNYLKDYQELGGSYHVINLEE